MIPTEAIYTGYTQKPLMNPYDAVLIDLISTTPGNEQLAKVVDRQKNSHNDTPLDQALVKLLVILKQDIMEGDVYLEPMYYRAIGLAVDTINLRYINAEAQERKASFATAPYYDVVVEIDGVQSTHTVQALTDEDAARQVLDDVTLGAEVYPASVKLISYDLA